MLTRRRFLTTSGSALATGLFASSATSLLGQSLPGPRATPPLRLGLIGCGSRGTGAAAQALKADPDVLLVAMGDIFPDRMQKSLATLQKAVPGKLAVTPDTSFIGFDAYEKVIGSGIDVVILTSPPGFRPQHLRAAIDAGKHVFAEKPVAVDAPGVRSVLESARIAKEKNLSLVVGFCWRYNPAERELIKRVHGGGIGEVRSVATYYNTGLLWSRPRQPGWSDLEFQLRNWIYYTALSGDIITEQAVHSVDKMSWVLKDVLPLRCHAHGGRQVRTDPAFGHVYDHFSVVYDYPNDLQAFHFCRQQAGAYGSYSDQFTGTTGVARIQAFRALEITGPQAWSLQEKEREALENMYDVEHKELFRGIRAGQPINDGVQGARSSLIAIMGRMAAYTGQMITWDQALNSQESLLPEKLDWSSPLVVPPVAMPGQTKFL